ncbi:hypothetical protein N0V82_009144 [Gnomoniopsis sp. IMI 355080]|nr:hypothetical protein N0V82_009144 [Gnomoniopsis sp. IMI 355080]
MSPTSATNGTTASSSHTSGLPVDEIGPSASTLPPQPELATGPFQRPSQMLTPATLCIHADDHLNTHSAVAPPLHTSTTFRYASNPDELAPWTNVGSPNHIYSRLSAPNTTRLEAVLSSLLGGPALTYSSGLSAFHALLVFLNPRRVAIGGGYHGCHGVVALVSKLTGLQKVELEDADALATLQPGDLIHVETPLNPTGEARNLEFYASKARELGCWLSVDATFAPPPLLEPFRWGCDVVMHSGTKYFGGHSDMLCGVLAVRPELDAEKGWMRQLLEERVFLGSVMGSLEGWLGVRSLRTLAVRVERQSSNATKLVEWLAGEIGRKGSVVGSVVEKVQHASLQPEAREDNSWLRRQMPRGWGPVFSVVTREEDHARRLPSKLHLFHHATSLGGVESLIEWRAISDSSIAKTVLRVSIGIEGWEDLREDLLQGFQALLDERKTT